MLSTSSSIVILLITGAVSYAHSAHAVTISRSDSDVSRSTDPRPIERNRTTSHLTSRAEENPSDADRSVFLFLDELIDRNSPESLHMPEACPYHPSLFFSYTPRQPAVHISIQPRRFNRQLLPEEQLVLSADFHGYGQEAARAFNAPAPAWARRHIFNLGQVGINNFDLVLGHGPYQTSPTSNNDDAPLSRREPLMIQAWRRHTQALNFIDRKTEIRYIFNLIELLGLENPPEAFQARYLQCRSALQQSDNQFGPFRRGINWQVISWRNVHDKLVEKIYPLNIVP